MHVTGVFNALLLRKASEPFIDQLKVAKSQLEMTDGYKPIAGRDADRASVALISGAFKDTSKVSRRLRRRHSHTHVRPPHSAYIHRDVAVNLHHIAACKQGISGGVIEVRIEYISRENTTLSQFSLSMSCQR